MTARVLMVLESVFPHPKGGGAELQIQTLGAQLVRRGLPVTVLVPLLAWGPQDLEDEVDGIQVVRLPYPRIRWLGSVVLLAKLAVFLLRHRHGYAAIHAHVANTMAAVCCLAGRVVGRPVVVKLSGGFELDAGFLAPARQDPLSLAIRFCLQRATYVQAISRRLAELLPARGFRAARVQAIPNAVDTRRFAPGDGPAVRGGLGLGDGLVGVFVGRLVPDKALGFFLEAWARVFAAADDVALLVVGDGELRQPLEEAAERLGRGHQIRFLGPRTDIERCLPAADFAVLPSASEGLSNALLEYMASGLPVLGSRISGTEDLVTPGETGWLFPRLDAAALEQCLREIAATPRQRLRQMGKSARRRVSEYAGLDSVAERIAALYGLPLLPREDA